MRFFIRAAGAADIPALRDMQLRSMRALGGAFYTEAVLETFVATFGTMDLSVIAEGHYFVAVNPIGALLGSGGWSQQPPGYDRGTTAMPVAADTATVRGVFTDPVAARLGVGRAIMRQVETDALWHGMTRLTLMATLSGIAFYAALGYRLVARRAIALDGELSFGCADMEKVLAQQTLPLLPEPDASSRGRAMRQVIEEQRATPVEG